MRCHILRICALALMLPVFAHAAEVKPGLPSVPSVAVCVSADASALIRKAAERVASACTAADHPLLKALAGTVDRITISDSAVLAHARVEDRALRHLILVGLPDDPLIAAAWQHEARAEAGGLYIFGFGHLQGDIGYLESDRNPFLHSEAIGSTPYETEIVTLTGSSPQGVAAAVEAFLAHSLINGVVAPGAWTRPATTLLDHDPLPPGASIPGFVPLHAGASERIAVSQGAEDEYRGVLADCQVEPRQIWRVKYHRADAWTAGGAQHTIAAYAAGLHRRAYGSTLWLAQFASVGEASTAEPLVSKAAHLSKHGDEWTGAQPPYSSEKESPGPLLLWRHDEWLLMSTLDAQDAAAVHASMH